MRKNKKFNWEKVVYVKEAPLMLDAVGARLSKTGKILDNKYDTGCKSYLYLDGDIHYLAGHLENYYRLIEKKLDQLGKIYADAYRIVDRFANTESKFDSRQLKDCSNSELVNIFRRYFFNYQEALTALYLPIAIDHVLTRVIKNYLIKKFPQTAEELFSNLTILTKQHDAVKYHNALAKCSNLKGENLKIQVNYLAKKFGFLGVRFYFGRPYTVAIIMKHLSEFRSKDIKYQETKKRAVKKAEYKKYLQALKFIQPSRKYLKYIKWLQEAIYFRTYRLDRLGEGERNSFVLLKEIGERIGLDEFDLVYLRSEEIISSLEKNAQFSKTELAERRGPFGAVGYAGKYDFYFGKNYMPFARKYLISHVKSTVIKGQVAYPGLVKGVACVVKTHEELKKIKRGQILITKMTLPDYIFAMQISAAVVTDFGGVTSHASVLSRELGKPCVIGTGNGTSVFRDGDLVEVDANQGIVRKISN